MNKKILAFFQRDSPVVLGYTKQLFMFDTMYETLDNLCVYR